jgi:hypothetical protein
LRYFGAALQDRPFRKFEPFLGFEHGHWKFLLSIALKAGLSDEDAHDVVQETVVAVAKGLRDSRFQKIGLAFIAPVAGRGSIAAGPRTPSLRWSQRSARPIATRQ